MVMNCVKTLFKWSVLIWVVRNVSSSKTSSSFECPSESGLYANPINCRRFYICSGGRSYDIPCPSHQFFDANKKLCALKSKTLLCGPIETMKQTSNTNSLVAPRCMKSYCNLPDCFCSDNGTSIPGGLTPKETPQMIILAFSGAVNHHNAIAYHKLLKGSRVNDNECSIKATFFVSQEYSSYYQVQKLYGKGHEIAVQSVSHHEENRWPSASPDDWEEDVIDIPSQSSNTSDDDLMEVPILVPVENNMMTTIYSYGYDSSLAAPASDVPFWPYTLDFRMPHRCLAISCPIRSFPGIWELPLNTMYTDDFYCALLDRCGFPPHPSVIYDFLMKNLFRHLSTNRAPIILKMHENWVTDEYNFAAFDGFIDNVLDNYPVVWFVTMQQAVAWLKNPTPIKSIAGFEPWSCEIL